MARLFGTDGIRGIANTQLSCEMAFNVGKAAAFVLTKTLAHKPTILIGKDTRISSDMLEAALVAGICSFGANVVTLGVIPTPAVAYLVRKHGADAGIMISASHNSMEYNGIKIFDKDGYKLSDSLEDEIEDIIINKAQSIEAPTGSKIGKIRRYADAKREYIKFLSSSIDQSLTGLKILIDCANGSAAATAQELFSKTGAKCEFINCTPDGININEKCGSTYLVPLSKMVVSGGFHIGIAFDGDADRVLMVDETGQVIDGDKILAALALNMKKDNKLKNDTVVVTVMTNMGFFKLADENQLNTSTTKVGDRYVLEEMLKNGYNLGGEQSGHIILLDYNTTGDGQLSALQYLCILKKSKGRASKLSNIMEKFPQVMINVKVNKEAKSEYVKNAQIQDAISKAQHQLGQSGRVLVRASGTEDLIRVMIEGSNFSMINKMAGSIADLIKETYKL